MISFSEIPALSIVFPASIKKGIASSVNLEIFAYICIGYMSIGSSAAIIAINDDTPKLSAMGTLSSKSTPKEINNIEAILILFYLL